MDLISHPLSLQEARQKRQEIKKGLASREQCLNKRSELECFLLETQLKAHQTLLKAHQLELDQPHSAHELFNKAKEYENLEKVLLQQIHSLDRELDRWEETEETDIQQLDELIISLLMKENPSLKEVYEKLKSQQASLQRRRIKAEKLLELLKHIEHLLANIQLARNRIKRQGLLSYIFGANPNLIVTQCLQGMITIIKNGKEIIEESKSLSTEPEVIDSHTSLYLYLLELEEQCRKRWSYRHLDTITEGYSLKIRNVISFFKTYQRHLQMESKEVAEEIEKWMVE
ncbi:MAG: hypothetical protein ACSNEK_00295 [Parachlamydiaceae bacterium]